MAANIIQATEDHINLLAPLMRKADVDEVWAAGKLSPHQALALSLHSSSWVRSVFVGDNIMCMFGVSSRSLLSSTGSPWLLGTDLVEEHPIEFLRTSSRYIKDMRAKHSLLFNYVDVRNQISIRWLRSLGFEILDPQPWGSLGLLFHRFEMKV